MVEKCKSRYERAQLLHSLPFSSDISAQTQQLRANDGAGKLEGKIELLALLPAKFSGQKYGGQSSFTKQVFQNLLMR